MPSVVPTLATAPPVTTTPPAPLGASIGLAPRYQVDMVLWGNRKRFVVRDTSTDTTVAIRTTSHIADSDLMRLIMTARTDLGAGPADRPTPDEPVWAPRDRQCARCRQFFPADPAPETAALEEWWACPPCRESLLGAHRPTSS